MEAFRKFPRGRESFNPGEEVMEGGLATTVGTVAETMVYNQLCRRGVIKSSPDLEHRAIAVGASLSYMTTTLVVAPIIHRITGTPDVKWRPFR